nr:alpha/beta hydrolase family protein [Halobacillus sp. A5]
MKRKTFNKREMLRDLKNALGSFDKTKNAIKQLEHVTFDKYERELVQIPTVDGLDTVIYVLTPKAPASCNRKYPAVLALHGHGKGFSEMVGNLEEPTPHRNFALSLVNKGFKVFVPEVIGFGERRLTGDKNSGEANSCYTLAVNLLMNGKTLAGIRVSEAECVLDYIKEQADVEKKHIGAVGFSGGGLIAALTSILDERVKATVLSGFVNTFKGSILHTRHCIDNYIPGLLRVGEMPELIGLIAPRPLFIEAGMKDKVFPLEPAGEAVYRLEMIYEELDVKENFSKDFFHGGHEVSGREAFEWLRCQLK